MFANPRDDGAAPWRLGLAVTKKTGSAVWRNRVRRLIRECFRLEQDIVPSGFDYVVVPKRSLDPRSLTMAALRPEITGLLRSAARKSPCRDGTQQ